MASKNYAQLTLVGDSKDLEKAFDRSSAAAKDFGSDMSRLDAIVGKGGADFRAYSSNLGGVGDGFNDVEDRAMGAGNIIGGVNDLMNPQGPQDYAMGLSDLAAGIRYTVVPSLQDGIKGVKGLVDRLGGIKGMLVGGGVIAGLGALVVGLKAVADQRAAERLEDFFLALKRGEKVNQEFFEKTLLMGAAFGDLDDKLREVANNSGMAAAERFVEMAREAGASDEAMAILNEELGKLKDEADGASGSVDGLKDSLDKLSGKMFSVEEAQIGVEQAFADFNEQIATQREELGAQATSLDISTQAGRDNKSAIQDLIESHFEHIDAMARQGASQGELNTETRNFRQRLIETLGQMGFNRAEARRYADGLNRIPRAINTNISLRGPSSHTLFAIRENMLAHFRNMNVRVGVTHRIPGATHGGPTLHTGGIVPGSFGQAVPITAHGSEMVLNPGQQQNLFEMLDSGRGGGGGGTPIVVNVHGSILSERDLVKVVRDAIDRGGFRR